jgi:hypothetical protein
MSSLKMGPSEQPSQDAKRRPAQIGKSGRVDAVTRKD